MQLQNSKYVKIDDNLLNFQFDRMENLMGSNQMNDEKIG